MDPTIIAQINNLHTRRDANGALELDVGKNFATEILEALKSTELPVLPPNKQLFVDKIWINGKLDLMTLMACKLSRGEDGTAQARNRILPLGHAALTAEVNTKMVTIGKILEITNNSDLVAHVSKIAVTTMLTSGISEVLIAATISDFLWVYVCEREQRWDELKLLYNRSESTEANASSSIGPPKKRRVIEFTHPDLYYPATVPIHISAPGIVKVHVALYNDLDVKQASMRGHFFGTLLRDQIPLNVKMLNEKHTRMDGKDFADAAEDFKFFAERLEFFAANGHHLFVGLGLAKAARIEFFNSAREALLVR